MSVNPVLTPPVATPVTNKAPPLLERLRQAARSRGIPNRPPRTWSLGRERSFFSTTNSIRRKWGWHKSVISWNTS